jgi:hypothetical protein
MKDLLPYQDVVKKPTQDQAPWWDLNPAPLGCKAARYALGHSAHNHSIVNAFTVFTLFEHL